MSFAKMKREPSRRLLLDAAGLSKLPQKRLNEEMCYWSDVCDMGALRVGRIKPRYMLGVTMLSDTGLQAVAAIRGTAHRSSEEREQLGPLVELTAGWGLGALAMSQLLRRNYDDLIKSGLINMRPDEPHYDIQATNDRATYLMHHPLDKIEEILPYDGKPNGYYEDDVMVVAVKSPAQATPEFSATFRGLNPGQEFDASFVTLEARLKASFIPQAS